jgi:hypothetical protein
MLLKKLNREDDNCDAVAARESTKQLLSRFELSTDGKLTYYIELLGYC